MSEEKNHDIKCVCVGGGECGNTAISSLILKHPQESKEFSKAVTSRMWLLGKRKSDVHFKIYVLLQPYTLFL